nr:SRPBCC family protein [Nitrosopumilus sp.]
AKGVYNIVSNKLVKLSENKTKYITEQEFEFKGFMKIIAFLMPGAFKKQSLKYQKDFKYFVENN